MTFRISPSPEPGRIDALDGVRGLAIAAVVMMHGVFFGVPLPGHPVLSPDEPWPRLALLGFAGVDLFFVLSGFLITGILVRSRGSELYFRNFYVRRARRIFPLYYVVLGLLLFGLGRPAAGGLETVSYLTYWQNYHHAFAGPHADPARVVTWSLAIEEQFYLVWPAIVLWLPNATLRRVCVATVVGAIALRWLLVGLEVPGTHFLLPCRLDALAAGAWLALSPLPGRLVGWSCAAIGAGGLLACGLGSVVPIPELPLMQRFALPAATLLSFGVLVVVRHPGIAQRVCEHRWLRSLGRYSYCIYLVHFLVVEWLALRTYDSLPRGVQRWLAAHGSTTVLLVAFSLVCLLVAWAIGWVSWHLCESRVLAWKRHFPTAESPRSKGEVRSTEP
ncbi:MAG: acyltransferase [Planctomycetes bacterium]|nr:acyltransferase [Planctomycetota bacterium]